MSALTRRITTALIGLVIAAGTYATATPAHAAPPGCEFDGTCGANMVASYQFKTQETGYYCGPAATRLALSAKGLLFTQTHLAGLLGTTTAGTNDIEQITLVMNNKLGAVGKPRWYENKHINYGSTSEKNLLRADILFDIDRGWVIVANVRGGRYDTSGVWHSYPGGHYLTVVGYEQSGYVAILEDIAISATGNHRYKMTLDNLSWWIQEPSPGAMANGYSA